jgi:hypothetical protein
MNLQEIVEDQSSQIRQKNLCKINENERHLLIVQKLMMNHFQNSIGFFLPVENIT